MVGFDDLRGLFQPMILWFYEYPPTFPFFQASGRSFMLFLAVSTWWERRGDGIAVNSAQRPFPRRKQHLALHVQTVATQIHRWWLHRLITQGFLIAVKINLLLFFQFRLILSFFFLFFSVIVFKSITRSIRKENVCRARGRDFWIQASGGREGEEGRRRSCKRG